MNSTRFYLPQPDKIPLLIHWAMAQPSIRAMLLTSTRAIPSAHVDILSDYDVILIVEDIQPFVADHAWLNAFGDVLIAYWDPVYSNSQFGIEQCGNVIQYTSGLKIDFSLWPVVLFQQIAAAAALPAELDAGYRVLLDKDQLTAALRPATGKAYVPAKPSLAAYQILINDFLSDAPYVAKCLWRDELLPTKWALDYDMKHIYLRQVLEWRIEMDHDWAVPAGSLGRGLKKRLSPEIWAQVEQTYASTRPADNWEALAHTLALFRQIAIEVGEHLGYAYPHELHQRVVEYVEHIKRMAKPA